MRKIAKKHPAHEAEKKGGGILHVMKLETDSQLDTALRALGVEARQRRTIEQIYREEATNE